MGAFINNDITAAGLLVLAKGMTGKPIKFTRIVMGDGYLEEGEQPRTLERVVSPRAEIEISKLQLNGDGTVVVGGIFTNQEEVSGFFYRELGLYAEDPDPEVGEVLYCYGNAGDLAEWIAPTGGSTVLEKTIDIITAVGTATNVTAYLNPGAFVTVSQFENYKSIALGAQLTAEQALALAKQAIAIANQASADAKDITARFNQINSKVATLWDAVFTEITTNPWLITFADLDGIILNSGVWNKTLQRLEC